MLPLKIVPAHFPSSPSNISYNLLSSSRISIYHPLVNCQYLGGLYFEQLFIINYIIYSKQGELKL